jgi:hypothetical protein
MMTVLRHEHKDDAAVADGSPWVSGLGAGLVDMQQRIDDHMTSLDTLLGSIEAVLDEQIPHVSPQIRKSLVLRVAHRLMEQD